MNRSRRTEPPDPSEIAIERILLASEGRAIPAEAIDFVARLAGPRKAAVSVFSIARVHGTAFGFPSPGLLPTKREWQEQRDLVARGGQGAAQARSRRPKARSSGRARPQRGSASRRAPWAAT